MLNVVTANTVVDDALDRYQHQLGPHAERYRNHVYRGLNYQRKLLELAVIPDEIALAWALHDIGLFTDGWDYIGPSLEQVNKLAAVYGIGDVDRVKQMVQLHHKMRSCTDVWAETFRVADRTDVSRGLLRRPLTRADISATVAAFPYLGFHALLVRTGLAWATTHPQRPLPMLRW